MAILVLLSDRAPARRPAGARRARPDLKHEPLSIASLAHVARAPTPWMLVDGGREPRPGVVGARRAADPRRRIPSSWSWSATASHRHPWHEVADEFVLPGRPRGRASDFGWRCCAAPDRRGATARSCPRAPVDRHRDLPGDRRRPCPRSHLQGVRAAAVPGVAPGPRLHPAGAAARGVGLRLLRGHAHGRRARSAPAGQARPRARAPDPDGASVGYRAAEPDDRDPSASTPTRRSQGPRPLARSQTRER